MRTQYVADIPLDAERLAKDLGQAESFRYSEAYSNYLIGGPWKNAVLWAAGGDLGNGLVTEYTYDQRPTFTEYGTQLPYLQELITDLADLSRLQFVRLVVVADSVIMPHRDYLELADVPEDAKPAHRMHIPLVTHDSCFFSEDNTVYRMRAGELWFVDAAQIHSVVSLTRTPRIHLILDFADRAGNGPLMDVAQAPTDDPIPARSRVARPPLPDAHRARLMRLAELLTMDTFGEVFGIVIKTHFRWDGGADFAWNTITELARTSQDPAVLQHALDLRSYFTLDRSDSKE
jgi:hypothetical protein